MSLANESTIFEELQRIEFVNGTLTGEAPAASKQPTWLRFNNAARTGSTGVKAMSLKEFVAGELALLPEVDAVLSARNGNIFYLWTVVNSADPELRRKVYEREKCIIDEFPELEFDFSVITRRNRDISSLVQEPGVEITFQRK